MEETLVIQVAKMTGLDKQIVKSLLHKWAMDKGVSPQDLTEDSIKEVMVSLVQDLFSEVSDGKNKYITL